MRIVLLVCLCACLHAQADPVFPIEPWAPQGLELWVESRFGYDTNIRLNDNRRMTSPYEQGEGFAGYALALPFGRFFCWGGARGRLQFLETEASVWSVGTRAGWAYGDRWEEFHFGADIGFSNDRQWVYEIYGPQTHHTRLHRGIYDMRTWAEVHYTGITAHALMWMGLHDFSEDHDDLFFEPSNFRFRNGAPPMEQTSHDFFRFGGLLWLAGAPRPTFSLGPYFWFDATHFLEQHNISPDVEMRNANLALFRGQWGSRIQIESEHVDFDSDLFVRYTTKRGGDSSPLNYVQYGIRLALRLEWPIIVGSIGLTAWFRDYDDMLEDQAILLPGGLLVADPDELVQEAGSAAFAEIRVRPLDWLDAAVRYEWEEWASSLPDLGYRKHDISLIVVFRW